MTERTIGEWAVVCGTDFAYIEECGEDGPYTRRVPYILVQASNVYGRLYACALSFAVLEEATAYVASLPRDFDPQTDDNWGFVRNVYGSEAYEDNWHEEEYSRMDDAERRRS